MSTSKGQAEKLNAITWIYSKPTSGQWFPLWQRTAGLDDDGEVWLPVIGKRANAMLMISSEPVVTHEGHLFARVTWHQREYPEIAEAFENMAKKIRPWSRVFRP